MNIREAMIYPFWQRVHLNHQNRLLNQEMGLIASREALDKGEKKVVNQAETCPPPLPHLPFLSFSPLIKIFYHRQ